ncbi:MAG: serine/threonine-protein kinase [Actinomycetota bacterium]
MDGGVDLGIDGLTGYRRVGDGGFATVYAAEETATGRQVAVKVLKAVDEAGRRRFDREQRVMGSTTGHPNIVTLFRAGYTPEGDQPFLVMEYLSGGSLQDLIDREGAQPWENAIDITLTIADALGFGHRAGIVHKDVKPANVLMSEITGAAKLTDFGIAIAKDGTQASQVAYSLHYCPPETFEAVPDPVTGGLSDPRDERSDLYSLAAMLMALGTGHAPFDSPTQASQMRRILTEEPPSTGIASLDAFFARALAKSPADRPPTAEAFMAELRNVRLAPSAPAAPTAMAPGAEATQLAVSPPPAATPPMAPTTPTAPPPASPPPSTAPPVVAPPVTPAPVAAPAASVAGRPTTPVSGAPYAPVGLVDAPPAEKRRGRGPLILLAIVAVLAAVAGGAVLANGLDGGGGTDPAGPGGTTAPDTTPDTEPAPAPDEPVEEPAGLLPPVDSAEIVERLETWVDDPFVDVVDPVDYDTFECIDGGLPVESFHEAVIGDTVIVVYLVQDPALIDPFLSAMVGRTGTCTYGDSGTSEFLETNERNGTVRVAYRWTEEGGEFLRNEYWFRSGNSLVLLIQDVRQLEPGEAVAATPPGWNFADLRDAMEQFPPGS